MLALYYELGIAVEQDYKKAFEWYQKAAEQGHDTAQYELGNHYYYGHGTEKSYIKAFEWYMKAAEQGNAAAEEALANFGK